MIILVWLVVTFLWVESNAFPIKLFPHRAWVILAIPIALLAAEAIISFCAILKNKISIALFMIIIIIGILFTSGAQKMAINTSVWPPGVNIRSQDEIDGLLWLKTLPPNATVFQYGMRPDSFVITMGPDSCAWCPSVIEYRNTLINRSADDLADFLVDNRYEYVYISGISFRDLELRYGANLTQEHMNRLLMEMQNSSHYSIMYQNKATLILQVI